MAANWNTRTLPWTTQTGFNADVNFNDDISFNWIVVTPTPFTTRNVPESYWWQRGVSYILREDDTYLLREDWGLFIREWTQWIQTNWSWRIIP